MTLPQLRARRRHPRRTQFDYLHLRCLRDDVQRALQTLDLPTPSPDVLDVFCGTRPYEDMLPAGSNVTTLDIVDHHGVADVVTDEFLPFDDETFDLVTCYQAFYFRPDPFEAAREIARVLRPGGAALITVPFAMEYEPAILEHRFTGPEMAQVFADWDDVQVVANGGSSVTWTMTTARIVQGVERRAPVPLRRVFPALYATVNTVGEVLHRQESRAGQKTMVLPPNVMLTARKH